MKDFVGNLVPSPRVKKMKTIGLFMKGINEWSGIVHVNTRLLVKLLW